VKVAYIVPVDETKMEIFIPYDCSGWRSEEEMKFLLQDFVLNAFYSYEREEREEPKLKLLKLACILGVNFRTA